MVANPFESERGFDNDLDGVLTSTPLGYSTPRIRVRRALSVEESPSKRAKAVPTGGGGRGERNVVSCEPRKKRLGEAARRLRRDFVDLSLSTDGTEPKRMKKHPSPSKETLECLEREFREYARDQIRRAVTPEEKDELANSFVGLTKITALVPRDKNRLVKGCSAVGDDSTKSYSPSVRKHSSGRPHSAMPTRIPCPVDGLARPRPKTRYGPMCRPANCDAMEVDELQRETTANGVGMM